MAIFTKKEKALLDLQNANTAATFNFNAQQADINRDWQEYMSNTSHQREVADLKAAGLNPVLSANGGATAYSSSSASGSADSAGINALASIINSKNQSAAMVKTAKINAKAAKYAADKGYASALESANASRYSADLSNSASKYATDLGYAGRLYQSNTSAAASRYGSKTSYKGTKYAANKSYKGTKYSSNVHAASSIGSSLINGVFGLFR